MFLYFLMQKNENNIYLFLRLCNAGSSKRDIVRKKTPGRGGGPRKESVSGQIVDDGSTYQDGAALNEEDPNYDSEVIILTKVLRRSFTL